MPTIGIALSGGGHRATVWALGVLLYLVDAGRNADVAAVSSVSGGSIANGVVAYQCEYREATPDDFRETIRTVLRHVAKDGLVPWGRQTTLYVAATIAIGFAGATLACIWLVAALTIGALGLSTALHVLGLLGLTALVATGWLFNQRSHVVRKAIAQVHFGGTPGPRLADLCRRIDHVFCATDLVSGNHLYLSPRFAYSYSLGIGNPGLFTLAEAVQASACLPLAFAPCRWPVLALAFDRYEPTGTTPSHVVLTDGGVYDNMADQWLVGLPQRLRRRPDLPVVSPLLDQVIVVNAGAARRTVALRAMGFPLLGELRIMGRVNELLYSGTTTHRRQQLFERSEMAERLGYGQLSMVLQTTQTPYTAADSFAEGDNARSERARETLEYLSQHDGLGRESWQELARRNAAVKTSLSRLGAEKTVDLLHHSYLTAMCGLHVVLGMPLLKPSARCDFAHLVGP